MATAYEIVNSYTFPFYFTQTRSLNPLLRSAYRRCTYLSCKQEIKFYIAHTQQNYAQRRRPHANDSICSKPGDRTLIEP